MANPSPIPPVLRLREASSRKNGSKWIFTEGRNILNEHSHCDINWAAYLSSRAKKFAPTGAMNPDTAMTVGGRSHHFAGSIW